MSMTTKKKLAGVAAAGAAATAIALGASGVAQADTASPTAPASTMTATTPSPTNPSGTDDHHGRLGHLGHGPGSGHRGGFGDAEDRTALATKLGVDKSALRTALGAVRDEMRTTTGTMGTRPAPGTRPDGDAMQKQVATALAKKLGIATTKVEAALTELRSAHDADRSKAFSDRLAQAVKDQKLTQAEADAVAKAAKAGVIGMGGDRAPR